MVPELPPELTPWNIDSVHGLRAAVIRALFFTYLPFAARIAAEKALTADPTIILRTKCVLQWHNVSLRVNLFKYNSYKEIFFLSNWQTPVNIATVLIFVFWTVFPSYFRKRATYTNISSSLYN